jgi:hypothetical protein
MHSAQKLSWVTKELNGLKNKTTKAAKEIKESECDCKRLRGDFTALKTTYQERHDDYRIGIEEEIKTDPKSFFFFRIVDFRKNVPVIHLS